MTEIKIKLMLIIRRSLVEPKELRMSLTGTGTVTVYLRVKGYGENRLWLKRSVAAVILL